MSRIPLAQPAAATGDLAASFDAVRARLGSVPKGFKVIGVSPNTLHGSLGFSDALAARFAQPDLDFPPLPPSAPTPTPAPAPAPGRSVGDS